MWQYNYSQTPDLYHHGVKGQKWGVRRKRNYSSTSIRSYKARKENEKIDKSFQNWKENSNKKETAIKLGKEANLARMEMERNKGNKELKKAYKTANKEYTKALKDNTTYRQGAIRQEVGKDVTRKYLTEAKRVKKQLDNEPDNRDLQKQYSRLMNQHDIERAKARKAADVGANRSRKKANMKRQMTKTVKAATVAGGTAVGLAVANKYLASNNVTFNGKAVNFSSQNLKDVSGAIKAGKEIFKYFY